MKTYLDLVPDTLVRRNLLPEDARQAAKDLLAPSGVDCERLQVLHDKANDEGKEHLRIFARPQDLAGYVADRLTQELATEPSISGPVGREILAHLDAGELMEALAKYNSYFRFVMEEDNLRFWVEEVRLRLPYAQDPEDAGGEVTTDGP